MLVLVACGGGATDVVDDTLHTTDTTVVVAPDDTSQVPETTTTTEAVVVESTTTTTADTASSDQLTMFREAAVASAIAKSGRFEATMMLAATPELPQAFTIYIEGAFNSERMEMKMDMSEAFEGAATEGVDLSAFGDLSDVRFIFDGETAYMKFPLFAIMGVQTDWVELPSDDAINTAGVAGIGNSTPANALAPFLDAGGDVTVVGTETIRGASTTHYRILFDVDDLESIAGDVSAQDLRDSGVEQVPLEVWISDNLIYRYVISYEGIAEAPVLSMQYDMFDYGQNVIIDLPNEDNVTPMDSFGP